MSYSALELNGKVAVVVGGTSGIGLAIARGLADAGADVVPTSRRKEQVEAAADEIERRGKLDHTYHTAEISSSCRRDDQRGGTV